MKKHLLFFVLITLLLSSHIATAGTGTEGDPYTIAEAIALSEGATEFWAQGYIVGGRYDDFATPWDNDFGISAADSDSESDVNNCLQVVLVGTNRTNWGLNTNPDNYQKLIKFKGYRDSYGGKPSFEGIDEGDIIEVIVADNEPPVATFAEDGILDVVPYQNLTITMDEAILKTDGNEVTDGDLSTLVDLTTNPGGVDVPFSATIDGSKKIITIDPTSDLTVGAYDIALNPVEDASGNESAIQSGTFTVTNTYVDLTDPVGGEKYYAGDTAYVKWNHNNVTTVDVIVEIPGTGWAPVASDSVCDGSLYFVIPADADYGDTYRLAIQDSDNPTTVADTTIEFTVIATPTINDIQSDHTAGMSNYDGDIVRTSGIITFAGNSEYVIQDGTGSWNGIYVYDWNFDDLCTEGDSVVIEAEVANYNDLTQLKNVVDLTVIESGKPLPEITTITTVELTEEYEGVLLQIVNAQVTNESAGSGYFEINDGSGALFVDDNLYGSAEIGILNDRDLTITGIGHQNTDFQLLPRSATDIVSATDTVGSTEYTVDQGGLAITGMPYSTTLATFEAAFEAADSATFDVFDADGTTPATVLDDTKKLIVTAADGITTATYTITRNAALTDATVTSSVYTVAEGTPGTITNIPYGTDLATFKSNITAPQYGSFEVYVSDGGAVATDLADGYFLTGTAEDGTTEADYNIEVSDVVPDTDSDVTEPTTQVAAATVVVVDGDDTEGFEAFSFDMNDAGTADGLPTFVSQIVLFYGPNMTMDLNTDDIAEGWFEINTTRVDFTGEPIIGADSIAFAFTEGDITIPDAGSVNVVLKLVLDPNATEGKVFQAMIDASQHGFETVGISSEFAPTFTADITGNDITIDVVATELAFTTEPTNVYIDEAIDPAVVVKALDANGNVDTDYVTDVTITATGADLTSAVSGTPVAGVATFDAISFSTSATGVTLTAASGTLTNGTSAAFDVTEVPDADLFFSEYIEGSSNNKALEIYNPTDQTIDLTTYIIRGTGNEATYWEYDYPFPDGSTIAPGEVFVIVDHEAVQGMLDVADWVDDGFTCGYNGNDARGLCKINGTDTIVVDIMGYYNNPSGDNYSVAGIDNGLAEHTLLRKNGTTIGNTDWATSAGTNADDSEWIVNEADDYSDLGFYGLKTGNDILSFSFEKQTGPAEIDATAHTVDIEVSQTATVTNLIATFTLSEGATAAIGATDQVSGTTENNFTSPVTYTVTAEDGTPQDWTVTVTVATSLSNENAITGFTVSGIIGNATIGDGTVSATVEYGTDITSLKPTFTISDLATIVDTTAAKDFTTPQTYTVTAEDGTPKTWTVTITAETINAVTIYDIQYTTDASGDSPELGNIISTSGIVTAIDESNIWVQDGTGAWNGIIVYSSSMAGTVVVGDEVEFVAEVEEYFNLTELSGVTDLNVISQGNTLPTATEITTLQAQDEGYEGVLVKVSNAECTNADAGNGMFEVNDGSGVLFVDDVIFAFTPTAGENYDIIGLGHYSFSERKILPRSADDIQVSTGIDTPKGIVSLNIYPNPSNGLFTLEMNTAKAGTFNVEIINISGQVIYTKQINQDGFYQDQINISNEAKGIYYIRIMDGNQAKVSKIMIQ